jgi:hypothetical protein
MATHRGLSIALVLVWTAFLSPDTGRAVDDYKLLPPADLSCELTYKGLVEYDLDGLISADVDFRCEGKTVDLIDGKLIKGWLATRKFGRIMIKQAGPPPSIAIFVTDEQKERLKRAFKQPPKTRLK